MTCKCNCKSKDCCELPCGCTEPVFDIDVMPGLPAVLKYNFGGITTTYDYTNMIEQTQTDTHLTADGEKRVLNYSAERHEDSLSAQQLGRILHVADLGDVNTDGIEDNALFVYQKNGNCTQGCTGIDNSWIAWNALDHQDSSLQTVMGFDEEGKPHALSAPSNTNQFYQLGWNAKNKTSWKQPTQFADDVDKVTLMMDKNTKEIGYVA